MSLTALFLRFLGWGCVAFGGPGAHVALFQARWAGRADGITEERFRALLALCQALPGPTSSQLAFALGHERSGIPGALAAGLGFLLPSALLMGVAGALLVGETAFEGPMAQAARQGLAWGVLAVVGRAVWDMARPLVTDRAGLVALLSALVLAVMLPGTVGQGVGLLAAAVLGQALRCTPNTALSPQPKPRHRSWVWLLAWAALVTPALFLATQEGPAGLAQVMARAGTLVFGGGHVVLPLLETPLTQAGLMPREAFLDGYALAQVMPGPLFSIGAYVGGATAQSIGLAAPVAAVLGVSVLYAPSILLLFAALPWVEAVQASRAQGALFGLGAGGAGLLAAAWATVILPEAVHGAEDLGPALALGALAAWGRMPVWLMVPLGAGLAVLLRPIL